jgi:hypothetical protein
VLNVINISTFVLHSEIWCFGKVNFSSKPYFFIVLLIRLQWRQKNIILTLQSYGKVNTTLIALVWNCLLLNLEWRGRSWVATNYYVWSLRPVECVQTYIEAQIQVEPVQYTLYYSVQHRKQTTHSNQCCQQYKEEKPTHKNTTRPKKGSSKTINIRRKQRNLIIAHENMKTQSPPSLCHFNLNE